MTLAKMKADAEKYLSEPVTVLSSPSQHTSTTHSVKANGTRGGWRPAFSGACQRAQLAAALAPRRCDQKDPGYGLPSSDTWYARRLCWPYRQRCWILWPTADDNHLGGDATGINVIDWHVDKFNSDNGIGIKDQWHFSTREACKRNARRAIALSRSLESTCCHFIYHCRELCTSTV